ncbi:MAG TPA: SDR family oxidoreductase [Chitinophagaceae bacterium]|jgi:NAD(P)-dependent dehydrogenase (short-subunit alcohol dehydrogenase family)|nr:SDR family oxidoreductase [Chitinophagaceae bacterium]
MKNIVVVGGTKGIGKKIVDLLQDRNVFIIARTKSEGRDSANIRFIEADVTQPIVNLAMLPEVIDGLVYCPGSINLKPFTRLTEQEFLNDWQINFMGAVRIIQQLLPGLKKAEDPSIVLFSTVAVSVGMPFHSSIAAAKGAVEGLTKSLAAELAPKIRINCIAPSLTETSLAEKLVNTPEKREAGAKRHPLQRIGQTSDIAALGCFLLSDQAAWITGQIMHVDGGMSTLKV